MSSIEITAADAVSEIGTEELLNAMEYSDIVEYVAEVERDKQDDEYDRHSDR